MSKEARDKTESIVSLISRRQFLKNAGVGVAALAGSGLLQAAPTFATVGSQNQVTLRGLTIGTLGRAQTFSVIKEKFETAHPGVTVEFMPVPVQTANWNEYLGKVATILASGQPIDLIEIGTEGQQVFASSGVIRPLNDMVMADKDELSEYFADIFPQQVETMMYQGDLYNTVWNAGVWILYYNRNLFDQAGISYPTNDWTIEEFQEAALAIADLGEDVYGFGWPNRTGGGALPWMFINDSNVLVERQYEGGEWLWDTFYGDHPNRDLRKGGYYWPASMANDPRNVEALQFLQDLTWVHNASPAPTDFTTLANFFSTNKLGMMPGHRFIVGQLINAGMAPEEFDVVYMPRWASQKHSFGTSGHAIATLSQNPELAWQLVKELISAEYMGSFVAGGVTTAPRRSVNEDPAQREGIGPENYQVLYNAYDVFPETTVFPAPIENYDFTTSFVKHIGLAMANEMTPQAALDAMHVELTAILPGEE